MASAGYVLGDAVINWIRGVPDAEPSALEMRLWTAPPGKDGVGGTEVTGGGYTAETVAFGAPTDGVCQASGDVTFATWPSGQEATHWSVHNVDDGSLLVLEAFDTAQTTSAGNSLVIPADEITMRVA